MHGFDLMVVVSGVLMAGAIFTILTWTTSGTR